jgi:hypothetical protein
MDLHAELAYRAEQPERRIAAAVVRFARALLRFIAESNVDRAGTATAAAVAVAGASSDAESLRSSCSTAR